MFYHVQCCTLNVHINIYILYGFSSWTSLYEWLSIFLWVFVMYIFVRMTIHIILVWVFVMYISVRMTIHNLMGFRHAHLCTYDYPFPCVGVFVMHISVRMTTISFWMGFRHAHFCVNDFRYSFGFSFVMYINVRMTICSQFLSNAFLLNGNSEFLGVYSSNVLVSPCA